MVNKHTERERDAFGRSLIRSFVREREGEHIQDVVVRRWSHADEVRIAATPDIKVRSSGEPGPQECNGFAVEGKGNGWGKVLLHVTLHVTDVPTGKGVCVCVSVCVSV